MTIDDIRMQQRSQQSSAIKSRREVEGVVRIGDRDPVTGRYQVLEPDGGVDPNGIKVFNSQEQYGDRVLPFRRIDGAIGLDSEKGSKARPPTAFPKCPGYLGNQVFNCEEPPKKKLNLWGLGLQDIGGDNGSRKLFLLDLESGLSYPIAEWPKKIPACPPAWPNPDDYPPEDYPDWEVTYSYTLTITNKYGTHVGNDSGLGQGNYAPVGSFFGVTTGMYVAHDGTIINEWFLKHGSRMLGSWNDDPNGVVTTSVVLSNVAIADMRGGPPGNPDPNNPPPTEPRDNVAAYTLSLTAQGGPIVRLRHSPQCTGSKYDFDKYFKLEPIGGTLQIKDYPGDSVLGNWRNDPPAFRCKGDLSGNAFVEFSPDRSFYWYAEPTIGGYTRPGSMILNAFPSEIRMSKISTPESGTCLITGVGEQSVSCVYSGTGSPSSLDLVAIAGYEA